MFSCTLAKLAGIFVLGLAVAATASAQYGGGGGGMGGSGGGSGNGSTGTGYNYGMSTGAKVGIGVGAAAGVTAVALLVHHHHVMAAREQASLIGCTESVLNGLSLKNETDNQTYTLLGTKSELKPGERVELAGSRGSGDDVNPAFHVHALVKDYGACGSASNSTVAASQPVAASAGNK